MILGWNFALTRLHMDAYLLKIDPMNSKHQELKQQPKQQHKRDTLRAIFEHTFEMYLTLVSDVEHAIIMMGPIPNWLEHNISNEWEKFRWEKKNRSETNYISETR